VVQEIAETLDRQEIGCDECFEELDRFVTMQLAGLDTAEALPLVQEHLHTCGECREEFEALLRALRATGEA
jgi:predicted anti-sigma-YlaC factor YlaD